MLPTTNTCTPTGGVTAPSAVSTVAIKSVVETGVAYSIMSRAAVVKELRLGTLVAIPLEPRLIRILSWVCLKEQFRTRRLQSFVEFATGRMKQIVAP